MTLISTPESDAGRRCASGVQVLSVRLGCLTCYSSAMSMRLRTYVVCTFSFEKYLEEEVEEKGSTGCRSVVSGRHSISFN